MEKVKKLQLNTPLKIDEIDFRIQSITRNGYATILAYKDARIDMNRLDAVYGVDGWQRKHEVINGKEFCSVGIWSERLSQWVWKMDCGTESFTEKEKGESSDAFKRACFNLGIGRELYDYPVIRVKLNADEVNPKNGEFYIEDGKAKQGFGLKLKEWVWFSQFDENDKLNYLAAKDQNGLARFVWGQYRKENINNTKK